MPLISPGCTGDTAVNGHRHGCAAPATTAEEKLRSTALDYDTELKPIGECPDMELTNELPDGNIITVSDDHLPLPGSPVPARAHWYRGQRESTTCLPCAP